MREAARPSQTLRSDLYCPGSGGLQGGASPRLTSGQNKGAFLCLQPGRVCLQPSAAIASFSVPRFCFCFCLFIFPPPLSPTSRFLSLSEVPNLAFTPARWVVEEFSFPRVSNCRGKLAPQRVRRVSGARWEHSWGEQLKTLEWGAAYWGQGGSTGHTSVGQTPGSLTSHFSSPPFWVPPSIRSPTASCS